MHVLRPADLLPQSVVLKPCHSRFDIATIVRPQLPHSLAADGEVPLALAITARTISPKYPWVVQEFVAGDEVRKRHTRSLSGLLWCCEGLYLQHR